MILLITYTYTFWKVLTVLSTVILSQIFFPYAISPNILYVHLQILNFINSIIKCNSVP